MKFPLLVTMGTITITTEIHTFPVLVIMPGIPALIVQHCIHITISPINLSSLNMKSIKCVVIGDSAVGKTFKSKVLQYKVHPYHFLFR